MSTEARASAQPNNLWVLWFAGAMILIPGLFVATIVVVTRISCGTMPDAQPLTTMLSYVWTGDPARVAVTESGCSAAAGGVWGTLAGLAGVVLILVILGFIAWHSYKQSDMYFIREMYQRPGIARRAELRRTVGPRAIRKLGKKVRPSLKRPTIDEVGHRFGSSRGRGIWGSYEDSVCVWGPARSGKGLHLVMEAILDAPGAVMTTSTRTDNYFATRTMRAEMGPVALFDPQGLTGKAGAEKAVRWSLYSGCEDQRIANVRASALVNSSGLGSSGNNAEWKTAAVTILQALLHAAALGRVSMSELYQWSANEVSARAAVDILKSHGPDAAQWGMQLEGVVNGDPKMRTNKWFGVSQALGALAVPEYREALSPGPGGGLDIDDLLKNSGTLYVLGTQSGGSSVGPFLVALLDAVKNRAEELAAESPGNRLDPPLALVLDEIANLGAIWPALKNLMSAGGGSGIMVIAFFQSGSQTRNQWGEGEAAEIFDNATISLLLGGLKNPDDLEKVAKLTGPRREIEVRHSYSSSGRSSSEHSNKEQVLDVDRLRRLPFGYGVMIRRTGRPIFVELRRWTKRGDAKKIKEALSQADPTALHELVSGQNEITLGTDEPIETPAEPAATTEASASVPEYTAPTDPTSTGSRDESGNAWVMR